MRLDVYLAEHGYTGSRTESKKYIVSGAVSIDGICITKPAYDVSEDVTVDIKRTVKYASRGGFKLEAAIDTFNINVSERLALDIGASSGGFTDCLLKNGAAHVISVDSGKGQIADFLRSDSRVTVIENYNARYMKSSDLRYIPNLAVMDVSFISATYIIPAVYNVIAEDGDFICLIKPQFEVGRSGIGKGGIVKEEKQRRLAIKKVTECAALCGFRLINTMMSPICGGDGNVEYLAYFKK